MNSGIKKITYASSISTEKSKYDIDIINGIMDFDLVVFNTSSLNVKISRDYRNMFLTNDAQPHGYSITDASEARIYGVERIQFTDLSVAFDFFGGTKAPNDRPHALWVAKTLGTVFGKESVANKSFVGIGLHFVDELNYSYSDLMQLAINARLGANPAHAQVVDLLYTNVVGKAPDATTRKSFTDLLDNGTFTIGSLGVLAADTELNKTNINLMGLIDTGLEYLPFSG